MKYFVFAFLYGFLAFDAPVYTCEEVSLLPEYLHSDVVFEGEICSIENTEDGIYADFIVARVFSMNPHIR